ncbi:MAG: hypothetical protein KDA92_19070, partial [Planctomycetales bacterium]|nr:hypothetical protein [Planctomycetales bacterium]
IAFERNRSSAGHSYLDGLFLSEISEPRASQLDSGAILTPAWLGKTIGQYHAMWLASQGLARRPNSLSRPAVNKKAAGPSGIGQRQYESLVRIVLD